jgi:hypothetical protein
VLVPVSLRLTPPLRLMLLTLADDPVYADIEVQWVRDASGTQGLVLLAVHRDAGTADVTVQQGLTVGRADYDIGAGLASFDSAEFAPARFDLTEQGVQLDLGVTLRDGRYLQMQIHEARRAPRPLVRMLAPAGHSMTDPQFFPFFWMDDIWFLRWRGARVRVTVDGRPRRVTRLGAPWRLARYAAHPLTGLLSPQQDGPLPSVPDVPGEHRLDDCLAQVADGPVLTRVSARRDDRVLAVTFDPPLVDLAALPQGPSHGRVTLWASDRPLLGGAWTSSRSGSMVRLTLNVDQPWDPGPQPPAAAGVFRALTVFRTWPTTYRWEATVELSGDTPTMRSRWTRV